MRDHRRHTFVLVFLVIAAVLLSSRSSPVVADEVIVGEREESGGGGVGKVVENATETSRLGPVLKEGSFADIIDRALQKEFPDNEQTGGEADAGSFNNSVNEQQAVLETVARVKPKKNETKEEKSFQFHDVFNLDNENRADDIPTLIDRKDTVFIISNPKSKYPVLQLDLRLISDLVVVIVSATCGGIAFACAGQPDLL